MRRIIRPALLLALPWMASCADDERNPFDPAVDSTPPQLVNFEIVEKDQKVFAAWSSSEPVHAVVEYVRDSDGTSFYSYPAERGPVDAGLIKLVGIGGNTDFTLSGVRMRDRAGNEVTAPAEGTATFRTGAVAAEDLFYMAMIDVGWGDALYFEAPDGTNALIDAGHPLEPDSRPPGGRHPVRWFLEKRGVTSLDFASMTHVHNDHIGGFYGDSFDNVDGLFLNQEGPYSPIPLGTFLDIEEKTPGTINGPYGDLEGALASLDAMNMLDRWVRLRTGASSETEDALQWGGDVRVDLLAAGRKDFLLPDFILGAQIGSVQNNDSMVYRIQYRNFIVVTMGDGEFATEQAIQNRWSSDFVRATILKLGHHGSNDSNSERFIRFVDPRIGFITNAISENPGVQHEFVLNRLRNLGIDYFASDRVEPNRARSLPGIRGDVHVLTDGDGFTVFADNIKYE